MLVCYDLDGTICADPDFYRSEMDGLRRRGHQVHILTATEGNEVTGQDKAQKITQVGELGLVRGRDYDELVAVPGPHDAVPANKVAYMHSVGASHLVDNRKSNCKAARKAGFTAHHHMSPKGS